MSDRAWRMILAAIFAANVGAAVSGPFPTLNASAAAFMLFTVMLEAANAKS